MILPQRELKHFSHYITDFNDKQPCSHNIIIHYSKPSIFGLRRWTRKYTFKSILDKQEGNTRYWEPPIEYHKLEKQLEKLSDDQWQCIPKELYDKIKDEYPEYMI